MAVFSHLVQNVRYPGKFGSCRNAPSRADFILSSNNTLP